MTVTAVKNAKKHLVAVFFENGGEVYVDKDVFLSNPIKAGDTFDEEALENLIRESDERRAYSRALWYLDNADCSSKALFDKLQKAGFEEATSKKAIEKLTYLGLLDDMRYAKHIAERLFEQNRSKREIYFKLTQKGISREIANEALTLLPDDESEQIKALIIKKYAKELSKENGKQKVFAALARKGFSYNDIKEILRKYCIEEDF